jgi:hypothetical protein
MISPRQGPHSPYCPTYVLTLEWKVSSATNCILFMHQNIKRFKIDISNIAEFRDLRGTFDDIAARMSALTELVILHDKARDKPTSLFESFENGLVRLLSSLSKLEILVIPRFAFTTRMAESLSRLPQIKLIGFECFTEVPTRKFKDIAPFESELSEGAFPSLCYLEFTATYDDTKRFLTIPFAPSNLTILYVESPNLETPVAIQQLLTVISQKCQRLTHLTLISPWSSADTNSTDSTDLPERVNMETLKPLLSFCCLRLLVLLHQQPLELQQKDLDTFASHWPSLEIFELGTLPLLDFGEATLTLDALAPFAQRCPNLTEFGVFMDASVFRLPTFAFPAFSKLKKLCVGNSIITEAEPVAEFLSRVLPLGCTIDLMVDRPSFKRLRRFSDLENLWKAVDALLPLLTRVRKEEREGQKMK